MLVAPAEPLLIRGQPARVLRPWLACDVDQLVAAWNDPALAAGAPPVERRTRDHASRWIAAWADRVTSQLALDLVIADSGSGTDAGAVVGEVGLAEISPHRRGAVLGYWIGETHRGRGLATAAVQAVVEWGLSYEGPFEVLGARVEPENAASIRVLEKAGFSRAGATRENLDVYFAKRGARSPRSD